MDPQGRNGIVVFKANHTRIDNLTVCNFLVGSSGQGNEIWWNGGDGSGQIGMGPFKGSYLSATSTYYGDDETAAGYGIFTSNSRGSGKLFQTYASNFSDSGYYIGACQSCNQVLDHAWSEYSALGYSGTNSGGWLVVKNSEFDNNQDGFDTNSQNNDDAPSPQNGACPGNATSSITHTGSCWVFMHNYVHDNNNPDVPRVGAAGAGPVGTGMSIAGGRNNTIMKNKFVHNGSWGLMHLSLPRHGYPSARRTLRGRHRHGRAVRVPLRRLGQCGEEQHVQGERLLRQPDQRRHRPDHVHGREPHQLLLRELPARRHLTRQPPVDEPDLRADRAGQPEPRSGHAVGVQLDAVRDAVRPQRSLPASPGGRHAQASEQEAQEHAASVQGRAAQPVVQVGAAAR